jgi:hypothetical protein
MRILCIKLEINQGYEYYKSITFSTKGFKDSERDMRNAMMIQLVDCFNCSKSGNSCNNSDVGSTVH